MSDDLQRWAAERAPELLARAQAEAVAVLRDALVDAAVKERSRPGAATGARAARQARPAPAEAPAPSAPDARNEQGADAGDALWTYCVLRSGAPLPDGRAGIAPSGPVERIDAGELAALVSRVPLAEFGPEPLRRNLNELEWLERVARSHEAVLERALETSTIVPLRLCTIYESEESVRRMLEREHDAFVAALDLLAGRQEWGVKLLIDRERLAEEARRRSPEAAALEEELGARTGGGAYMLGRRLDRHVREVADSLAAEVTEQVHTRLQECTIDAVTRPAQNRDLSGHEGEMLLNAAYLVEAERVAGLAALVAELEQRHRQLGARIELTGPWPPYNFVPGGGTTAIA